MPSAAVHDRRQNINDMTTAELRRVRAFDGLQHHSDMEDVMGLIKEFKEFAMRGNVVDLAVGVIMGAAFSPIVKSFVDDIIMPPIGYLIGKVKFSELAIHLPVAPNEYVPISYGKFINAIIAFVITAWAIFMLIKVMNRLTRKKEAAPLAPSKSEELLTEIRDL